MYKYIGAAVLSLIFLISTIILAQQNIPYVSYTCFVFHMIAWGIGTSGSVFGLILFYLLYWILLIKVFNKFFPRLRTIFSDRR